MPPRHHHPLTRSADAPRPPLHRCFPALVVLLATGLSSSLAWSQSVVCHVAYAGAERALTIPGVSTAAEVPPQIEGRTFVFHVLNKTAPFEEAAVTVTTTLLIDGEPRWLHQATYLAAAQAASPGLPHGFTGLQAVQEPQSGREWRYWCERPAGA
ncbi:MAG TPA: hypothetical protein VFY35_01210 [Burkholderiaceae bacterium]|nr:hypothetical protein [Burkholderiaceae bacterium]